MCRVLLGYCSVFGVVKEGFVWVLWFWFWWCRVLGVVVLGVQWVVGVVVEYDVVVDVVCMVFLDFLQDVFGYLQVQVVQFGLEVVDVVGVVVGWQQVYVVQVVVDEWIFFFVVVYIGVFDDYEEVLQGLILIQYELDWVFLVGCGKVMLGYGDFFEWLVCCR